MAENVFYDVKIFSVKNPSNISYMQFFKSDYFQPKDKLPSLYISLLLSSPSKTGLGRELLNFAKKHNIPIVITK